MFGFKLISLKSIFKNHNVLMVLGGLLLKLGLYVYDHQQAKKEEVKTRMQNAKEDAAKKKILKFIKNRRVIRALERRAALLILTRTVAASRLRRFNRGVNAPDYRRRYHLEVLINKLKGILQKRARWRALCSAIMTKGRRSLQKTRPEVIPYFGVFPESGPLELALFQERQMFAADVVGYAPHFSSKQQRKRVEAFFGENQQLIRFQAAIRSRRVRQSFKRLPSFTPSAQTLALLKTQKQQKPEPLNSKKKVGTPQFNPNVLTPYWRFRAYFKHHEVRKYYNLYLQELNARGFKVPGAPLNNASFTKGHPFVATNLTGGGYIISLRDIHARRVDKDNKKKCEDIFYQTFGLLTSIEGVPNCPILKAQFESVPYGRTLGISTTTVCCKGKQCYRLVPCTVATCHKYEALVVKHRPTLIVKKETPVVEKAPVIPLDFNLLPSINPKSPSPKEGVLIDFGDDDEDKLRIENYFQSMSYKQGEYEIPDDSSEDLDDLFERDKGSPCDDVDWFGYGSPSDHSFNSGGAPGFGDNSYIAGSLL